MKYNCHTHTTFCDGKNTAEEMVLAAIEKDFSALGFSGHSTMDYPNDWEMSEENVQKYIDEIRELSDKYKEKIDVICGIELDADYKNINLNDFAYAIGSVHQLKLNGEIYSMDYTAEELKRCIDNEFDGNSSLMAKTYFDRLADFITNENVDVVGHFDLITKFNEKTPQFDESNSEYRKAATDAVEKILAAKPGMIFEVNTGAMYRKGNSKPYPSEFILKKIHELGGRVTITSDAHCTEALDFAFDKASEYCKMCGIDNVYFLTKNGWWKEAI